MSQALIITFVVVSCVLGATSTGLGSVGYAVNSGSKGEKGEPGDKGVKGITGVDGDDGDKGSQGQKGNKGEPGETGSTGSKGTPGDIGDKGSDGADGIQGNKGMEGFEGQKGNQGEPGTATQKGDQGPKGNQGTQGDTGIKGEEGPIGTPGTFDTPGDKGEQGPKGPQGQKGEEGPEGEQGTPGVSGEKGDPGEKGEKGNTGSPGQKGEPGDQGPDGDKGDQGDQGQKGEKGVTGQTGPKGNKGDSYTSGTNLSVESAAVAPDGGHILTPNVENGIFSPAANQFQLQVTGPMVQMVGATTHLTTNVALVGQKGSEANPTYSFDGTDGIFMNGDNLEISQGGTSIVSVESGDAFLKSRLRVPDAVFFGAATQSALWTDTPNEIVLSRVHGFRHLSWTNAIMRNSTISFFADGTEAAPSISFTNRTQSGFFLSGTRFGVSDSKSAQEILSWNPTHFFQRKPFSYEQNVSANADSTIFVTSPTTITLLLGLTQNITLTDDIPNGLIFSYISSEDGLKTFTPESGTISGDASITITNSGASIRFLKRNNTYYVLSRYTS